MTTYSNFNLVDEPWIPVADRGLVTLMDAFGDSSLQAVGGTPLQKVCVMKLLLAIAQAASTRRTETEHSQLSCPVFMQECQAYLSAWRDRFFLYGDKPFLQVPAIERARVQPFGAVIPEVSTGNTTILLESQVEQELTDAEKALLLVTLMSMSFGGKKTDNSVVLAQGYAGKTNDKGKPSTSRPGPGLAFMGLLHNFVLGESICETLLLNMLTHEQVEEIGGLKSVGVPPWETMPESENCPVAQTFKESLMGRLVPLSRFCLLTDKGLHYSEGLAHLNYADGVVDTSVAVDYSSKKPRVLWANPEKRPWRELTSLLTLVDQTSKRNFECLQIKIGLSRVRKRALVFGVWSGGVRVSNNAGEQYVSGTDDMVESVVWIDSATLGDAWFSQLKVEMNQLELIAKKLYGAVHSYFDGFKREAEGPAKASTSHLWSLFERDFQSLVDACSQTQEGRVQREVLHQRFVSYLFQTYDGACPRATARQLEQWARCKPRVPSNYLERATKV